MAGSDSVAPSQRDSLSQSRRPPAPDSEADSAKQVAANEDFLFHLYRGSELLQDNRVHEAKEELERALTLQPGDSKGQDLLAVVYFRIGHYPRAIRIYEQLKKESPKDPALKLNLALCYLKTGQAQTARQELEELVLLVPGHARAWGYLGLVYERIGDFARAESAFEHGGHPGMAKRMSGLAASRSVPPPSLGSIPPTAIEQSARMSPASPRPRLRSKSPEYASARSRAARDAAQLAFEQLDAGTLTFALAESASETSLARSNWEPIEPGQVSKTPDTRDGPPPVPERPHGLLPTSGMPRRNTLVVAPPPAHVPLDIAADLALASAPAPIAKLGPPPTPEHHSGDGTSPATPERGLHQAEPPRMATLAIESKAVFPGSGSVLLHPSGLALVKLVATGAETEGFAVRLDAIRSLTGGLDTSLLERHAKGRSTGEPFGGIGSPVMKMRGDGELVLAPRPGHALASFSLEDDTCFIREDALLGFDLALGFENGRLATGEGEFFSLVQLRGRGSLLLEIRGSVMMLGVTESRSTHVRRDIVLGWLGRMVPRALAPSEAPFGQRGLVSFGGTGTVLIGTE